MYGRLAMAADFATVDADDVDIRNEWLHVLPESGLTRKLRSTYYAGCRRYCCVQVPSSVPPPLALCLLSSAPSSRRSLLSPCCIN
jgi:hypothetical protein